MALMFFAVIVFATSFTIVQWLEKQRTHVFAEWETQERGQMALVVQKIARFSAAETYFPFILRQATEMLRKNTPDYAFALLKPWNKHVRFSFFDASGKRIAVPGFLHEKVAISEQVMASLLRPESLSENRRTAISGAFIGKRSALSKIGQMPEALITLKGNSRFSHAGWWRLSGKRTANVPYSEQIAHVLVLIEADAFKSDRLLKEVLKAVRGSLPDYYRLAVQKSWQGTTNRSLKLIEEKARLTNGLTVSLRRDPIPDKYHKRLLVFWDFLSVAVKSFFMCLLAFGGKYLFTVRRNELSLSRIIGIAIFLVMMPVLGLFSQWCFDYMQTSTLNTVRQQHRIIERRLNIIDKGLLQYKSSFEGILSNLNQSLEDRSVSQKQRLLAVPRFGEAVEAVYLVDESGNVVETFSEVAVKKKASREVASFLVTNLVAHVTNVSSKKSSASTFNLSYVRQLSRSMHQQLGKIMDLNWGGHRRGLYLSFVRNSQEYRGIMFLVALLNPDRLFRDYLAALSQTKMSMRFGVVEMTENGPKSSMPDQLLLNTDLLMLSEEVWRLKRTIDRLIDLPGRGSYLVTGIHPRHMGDVVLIGATPFRPIAQRNHNILSFFILFVAFSFSLAALSALYISGNLGFSIKRLAKALERVKNHEFITLLHTENDSESRIFSGIRKAVHTLSEIYDAQPLRKKLVFEGTIVAGCLTLESFFYPGKFLGGDYVEAIPLTDNRLLFCIGEIAGKPIPATLLIARIKMCVSLLNATVPGPERILLDLNEFFVREKQDEQQIRLLCAITDGNGSLEIANAGHHPPILVTGSGAICLHDDSAPLGKTQPPDISCQHIELEAGASLFFATSGCLNLFDRLSPEKGMERLRSELEAAPEKWCSSKLNEFWALAAESGVDTEGSNEDRSLAVLRRPL
ncbi:MAG: serine/threonine-protein phosphatase [Candidatus Riflebacteria bacterium]|nr:serine/threonine-protein phosphatase [Candidatus Riflebacteria bacterium]